MIKLKQQFVMAMESGNYGLAQDILGQLFDFYRVVGFDTIEERNEFEAVVKWFDKNVYEAVLV